MFMFDTLPQGIADFENFAVDVIKLAELPDNDSTRFAVAAAVLHYPQPEFKAYSQPREYLADVLKRAAANQVAGQIFQDIKLKQQEAHAKAMADAAEHDKKQADASATTLEASNVQTSQA